MNARYPVVASVCVLGALLGLVAASTVRTPSASWAAGTLIATPGGPVAVESIVAGDSVLTLDVAGRPTATRVRSAVARGARRDLVRLSLDGAEIILTGTHMLAVPAGGGESGLDGPDLPGAGVVWAAAESLEPGDPVFSASGNLPIVGTDTVPSAGRLVYNLQTDAGSYLLHDLPVLSADADWSAPVVDDDRGYRGGACFPAGTAVHTADGLRPIETLRTGDRVLSRNPKDGSWALRRVTGVHRHEAPGDLVTWTAGNADVSATANHPVYVAVDAPDDRPRPEDVPGDEADPLGGRWIAAGDLRVGDLLLTPDGLRPIDRIRRDPARGPVHNISIEGWSSYLVGRDGILVHNKGSAESEADGAGKAFGDMAAEERSESSDRIAEGIPEPSPAPMPETGRPRDAAPSESGLRAGYADDNKQFSYYLDFLETHAGEVPHETLAVEERIVFAVSDRDGRSVPNARMTLESDGLALVDGLTHADGTWTVFPGEYGSQRRYRLSVESPAGSAAVDVDRKGPRRIPVELDGIRPEYQSVPMDVLFVLDTTGSMGEEIRRLKQTIEIIHMNLTALPSRPDLRFGLVLYRDRGDEYLTRVIPFTGDVEAFRSELDQAEAGGGGDTPEDLEAALEAALRRLAWTPRGIRLGFVITDAPPHLDYESSRTSYADSVRESRRYGIKFHTVGTGGLPLSGEYVLRQIAQYTGGRYIFLTYGETGESEGGAPGSVSHHTGANWTAENLETIIIRFAKEELSQLSDEPLGDEDDWWSADPREDQDETDILDELFVRSLGQLLDYSAWRPDGRSAALLPFEAVDPGDAVAAEYLGARALLALKRGDGLSDRLRLAERADLQDVLDELNIQLTGLTAEDGAARIGEILGAEMLITGTLHRRGGDVELFLKLIRTETAEILSVTRVRADRNLLP